MKCIPLRMLFRQLAEAGRNFARAAALPEQFFICRAERPFPSRCVELSSRVSRHLSSRVSRVESSQSEAAPKALAAPPRNATCVIFQR